MAGFLEKIIDTNQNKTSKYLDDLLLKAKNEFGENSSEYKGIYNQYYKMPIVSNSELTNRRHYEAEMHEGDLKGLERLYQRSVVIDLLSACAAECVYCLRGYYEKFTLTKIQIDNIVDYCSKQKELKEVLITGGDPFFGFSKLKYLITGLAERAKNIEVIRIGTRLMVHDPKRFDESIFDFFKSMQTRFIFEIGVQINHYYELQPESTRILKKLQGSSCRIYAQNVLLKDVNNNFESLVKLYDELRYIGIAPHYLFHAVPMKGTDNFRTTVQEGIDLIRKLTSSGYISGRAKPQYALMTDIGKVTLYQDTIKRKEGRFLIVNTEYNYETRLKWNPSYKLPENGFIEEDGTISIKYLDGV